MGDRFTTASGEVKRTQRYPQYSREELYPFLAEVWYGFPFEEAATRAGLDWVTTRNTLYSHDDLMEEALDLSMIAGELIRRGLKPTPDRHDGLYDHYKKSP